MPPSQLIGARSLGPLCLDWIIYRRSSEFWSGGRHRYSIGLHITKRFRLVVQTGYVEVGE